MSARTTYVTLTPRDPLIARDGRPFDLGLRMKSLDWLYPSVSAGSLRTMLGNLAGGFPPSSTEEYSKVVESLKRCSIAGPFPCAARELCFPRAEDVVFRQRDGVLDGFGMRPADLDAWGSGAGCDLPDGVTPAILAGNVEEDFKAVKAPPFWSCSEMVRWLVNADGQRFFDAGTTTWPVGFLQAPTKDVRTHVHVDAATGTSQTDAGLFESVGLDLYRLRRGDGSEPPGVSTDVLSIRATTDDAAYADRLGMLNELHPLGGERRLILWQAGSPPVGWSCPDEVRRGLRELEKKSRQFVRMVLGTPALFIGGWRPGWLREETTNGRRRFAGRVPGTDVTVCLHSACVTRWQPISGWSYEYGSVGAKPVRRLVPAGSVYFLEVTKGHSEDLAERWLESVGDESGPADDHQYIGDGSQNRRDGFGLALWGTWEPAGVR
jgi:CRISPR-associated protein Cmr3